MNMFLINGNGVCSIAGKVSAEYKFYLFDAIDMFLKLLRLLFGLGGRICCTHLKQCLFCAFQIHSVKVNLFILCWMYLGPDTEIRMFHDVFETTNFILQPAKDRENFLLIFSF